MTTQNKNVPTLRFPEFNSDWGTTKLGEYLTFKNGINADKSQYGQGVKFINVLDIINNNTITHDKIIGRVNVSENELKKNEVKYGDILFQRSSETREEVGQSNVYIDKKLTATFGGFVIRGQAIQEYNPLFFNYLLKTSSAREEITTKSGGSTRYNIGQETLREVKINLPTLPEQQKIATFLTTVDEKIQQLSKKKDLLDLYKKGMMQKIFNQEIRFKDDNGNDFADWEKKKLGEVCNINKGEQLNSSELTLIGDYPALNGGINPSGYTDKWNKEKNTITISEGGNSCGYVNFVIQRFWCGGHCYALENLRPTVSNIFLYQVLKHNESEIMRLRVGSGLPNIQKKDVNNFLIQLPDNKEQQKIANFLSAIDEKINLVKHQLEKTKEYKKGLLQQMFI